MNIKKLSSKANNTHKQAKAAIKAATVNLRNKRKAKQLAWELVKNAKLYS